MQSQNIAITNLKAKKTSCDMPWISNNQIQNILLRIVTVVDAYIAALIFFDRPFRLPKTDSAFHYW